MRITTKCLVLGVLSLVLTGLLEAHRLRKSELEGIFKMPDKEIIIDDFKGISRNSNRSDMPPGYFWNLINGYVDVDIATGNTTVRKRGGTSLIFNDDSVVPDNVLLMGEWEGNYSDGAKKLIFVKDLTTWYQAASVGVESIKLASKYTPGGSSKENDWCIIRPTATESLLVLCSGIKAKVVDSAQINSTDTWTATIANLSLDAAQPETSTVCHIHQRRVWLNNTAPAKKMIAYGSMLDDPRSSEGFSKNGESATLDVGKFINENDEIVGFRSLGNLLIIFLHNYIAIYNAPVTWENIAIQKIIPIGAVSNKAITVFGNDIYFISSTGIKKLSLSDENQQVNFFDLTRNIQPIFNELITLDDYPDASACFDPNTNLIYFSIVDSSLSAADLTGYEFMVYSPYLNNIVGFYRFQVDENYPARVWHMYYHKSSKTMIFNSNKVYKHFNDNERTEYLTYKDQIGASLEDYELKIELPSITGKTNYSMVSIKEVKTLIDSREDLTLISGIVLSSKYSNESSFTDLNFALEDDIVIEGGANLYSVFDVGNRGRGCQINISNSGVTGTNVYMDENYNVWIAIESIYIKMSIEGKK